MTDWYMRKSTFIDSDKRRYKRVDVSPEIVMSVFDSVSVDLPSEKRLLHVNRLEGLPVGCEIRAVTYLEISRTFSLLVYHPDFESVPQAEIIPLINVTVNSFTVDIADAFPAWQNIKPIKPIQDETS